MERRARIFWAVCIPTRLAIAVHAADWTRVAAAVIGARWLAGLENGNEGFFGGPTWWAEERPIHGVLWVAYAVSGRRMFLFADTAFGAYNWLSTHSPPRAHSDFDRDR
jgi:hypothetical protein